MAHFSATPTVAGSGNTIRLGSLEYPALSPVGMRVPLVFKPSQAFHFRSLDFIADRLGVLHLREETHNPAPVGETSSIDSGRATSMARHLRFIPSKLSTQTPL